jgi:hypothetical protein
MNHLELIERFCEIVNKGLAQGKECDKEAYEQLLTMLSENDQCSLLDQLAQNYCLAQEPTNFSNLRIGKPDERFEQCYELLHMTFDEDVLDPKSTFAANLALYEKEQHPTPPIIVGRFWQVSGPQQYDPTGQLKSFGFDPLTITNSVAGVISGNYMSMVPALRQNASMGAIGHLATRRHLRRGGGHGTALLQAFEQEVSALAAARGETLQVILLEAETDSWQFWAKRGYRWPAGSRYCQPPLEFDPVTGERFHDEVPELLMVKLCQDPLATHIDTKLLLDAVHTMYQNWCVPETTLATFTAEAAQRATDYVFGKVFAEFEASLPPNGEPVALVKPPDNNK